jgi:hypothetical protein
MFFLLGMPLHTERLNVLMCEERLETSIAAIETNGWNLNLASRQADLSNFQHE